MVRFLFTNDDFFTAKKKIQSKRRGANTVLPDSVIFFCRHAIFFLNFFFAFFSHFRARTFFILLFSSFFLAAAVVKPWRVARRKNSVAKLITFVPEMIRFRLISFALFFGVFDRDFITKFAFSGHHGKTCGSILPYMALLSWNLI